MSRAKLILITGLVALVAASSTFAAGSLYWKRTHGPYSCSGTQSAVFCKRRGGTLEVFISSRQISVFQGEDPIFSCHAPYLDAYDDCIDYR